MANEAKLMAVFSAGLVQAACAAVTLSVNEARTRAVFSFASAESDRRLYLAYGNAEGGKTTNAWDQCRLVATVPAGCTSIDDVVLPDDFAVSGRVARAFLSGYRPTTLDYVQDGLALQYDAIENAGRGQHADAPTAWVDLVGGKNLPLVTEGAETDSASADYMFIGGSEHDAGTIFSQNCSMTMEAGFAVTAYRLVNPAKETLFCFNVPSLGMIGCEARENMPGFQFRRSSPAYARWTASEYANLAAFVASGNFAYCSLRPANFSVDDQSASAVMIDGKGRVRNVADCSVGAASGLNLLVGNVDTRMKVRSLRIYNRTLTDDEQLWNYAVDRARFEGDETMATFEASASVYVPVPLQVVRILKAVPEVSPLTFEVEFTGADRSRRLCIGWARRDQGESCTNWMNFCELATVPAGTTALSVEIPDALAAELAEVGYRLFLERTPRSDDYVLDGLVLQYDAIENAGRGRHDAAPTAWADLVGGKNLPLVSEGTEADSASADYMTIGASEHNVGTIFSQNCDMTMEAGFAVTAYRLDNPEKETLVCFRVPALGMIGCEARESMSGFQVRTGAYVRWLASEYKNLAAFVASGNFAYCSVRPASFQYNTKTDDGFAFIDGKWRLMTTADFNSSATGLNLLVGNVDTRMKVRSLRIYNRTLTDDEQLWNYAVDRARFEGDFGEAVRFCEASSFAQMRPKGTWVILK